MQFNFKCLIRMNMCSALLGGIPVAFQEYLPYNGLCWM